MTAWIGIDPGGRDTGVVALDRTRVDVPRLITGVVVTREVDEDTVDQTRGVEIGPRYLAQVLDAVDGAIAAVECVRVRLAVETVVPPNPHVTRRDGRSLTNPKDAIAAAIVLGAVLARWPVAVRVPPSRNGAALLATYPPEFVTAGERRLGLNRPAQHNARVCHLRSAWDVALQGPGYARAARTANLTRQEPLL